MSWSSESQACWSRDTSKTCRTGVHGSVPHWIHDVNTGHNSENVCTFSVQNMSVIYFHKDWSLYTQAYMRVEHKILSEMNFWDFALIFFRNFCLGLLSENLKHRFTLRHFDALLLFRYFCLVSLWTTVWRCCAAKSCVSWVQRVVGFIMSVSDQTRRTWALVKVRKLWHVWLIWIFFFSNF